MVKTQVSALPTMNTPQHKGKKQCTSERAKLADKSGTYCPSQVTYERQRDTINNYAMQPILTNCCRQTETYANSTKTSVNLKPQAQWEKDHGTVVLKQC